MRRVVHFTNDLKRRIPVLNDESNAYIFPKSFVCKNFYKIFVKNKFFDYYNNYNNYFIKIFRIKIWNVYRGPLDF